MEKIIPTPESDPQAQVQSPSAETIAVVAPPTPTVAEVVIETETPDPVDTPHGEKPIYPLPPTKRAKWLRNIAGVLMVVGIILYSTFFLFSGFFSSEVSIGIFFSLVSFLEAFGILFLLFIPTNLPTRIALSAYIVWFFTGNFFLSKLEIPLVAGLVCMYIFSLIVQNNRLSAKELGWIHIIFLLFLNWNLCVFGPDFAPTEQIYIQNFPYNILFSMIVWPIFRIIAWWKFTRLALFNGHIDTTLKANYSPLNRYMLGYVVAIIVATLGMWLIYGNAHWILSLI